MSNDAYKKQQLFKNFLDVLDDSFVNKNEFLSLHQDNDLISSNLKIRKDVEKVFTQAKLKQIIKELDQLNFEKNFSVKRNDEILEKIQKDNFRLYNSANESEKSRKNLQSLKDKYKSYLDSNKPQIKNELNYQLLSKQNELLSLKAIQENEIYLNEEKLKLENDYFDKILRQNELINKEISNAIKINTGIELERLKQKKEEELRKKEEMAKSILDNLQKKREHENKLFEEEKNEYKPILINQNPKIIESDINSNYINDNKLSIIEEEKEDNKLRGKKIKYMKIKETIYEVNNKDIHKKGKLDSIRQEKVKKLNESLRESQIKNQTLSNRNKKEENPIYNPLIHSQLAKTEYINLDNINNDNKDKSVNEKLNETKKIDDDNEIKQSEFKIENNMSENENRKFKDSMNSSENQISTSKIKHKNSNEAVQNSINSPQKKSVLVSERENKSNENDSQNINKIIKNDVEYNIENSKEEIISKTSKVIKEEKEDKKDEEEKEDIKIEEPIPQNITQSNINEDYTDEKLFEEKPDLNSHLIKIEYKILVLKKLILKIEKYSKTYKPNNFIYIIKYANTGNKKDLLKNKFYELLDVKNNPEKEKEIFSKLDIDTSLYLIFEILHSNPNPNLNADDIKNNPSYSENDFDNDLDKRFKPIVDLVIEHFKKMLNEKRVQLSVACNFINKGLLNFDFEDIIESRLLIVLEKKLKKKKNQPVLMANTFSGGFNLNPNIQFTQSNSPDRKMMSSSNFSISNLE